MARSIPALAVLLLCVGAVSAADDKKVVIRWHGQSFFEIISTKGTRIVTDPHAIEEYGRPQVKADLILMSHFHVDHTRLDAITNLKKAKQINALKKAGEGGRGEEWNIIDEKFKDVHIQTIGTFHDDMAGAQRGKNGVFILDVDGLRIVHLGDLGHKLSREQLKKSEKRRQPRVRPIDVLMIPVGGVYTLNGLEAQKVVAQIKPTTLHPAHALRHARVPRFAGPRLFPRRSEDGHGAEIQATNEMAIDPKAEAPKEPIIAILNWEKKGKKD